MLVPPRRALRFLVASDGLWDLVPVEKAAKAIRNKLPHEVGGGPAGWEEDRGSGQGGGVGARANAGAARKAAAPAAATKPLPSLP
jgi:hypothetical protein